MLQITPLRRSAALLHEQHLTLRTILNLAHPPLCAHASGASTVMFLGYEFRIGFGVWESILANAYTKKKKRNSNNDNNSIICFLA